MSTIITTPIIPTDLDLIQSILRDPITGRWVVPVLNFNTRFFNPYYGEVDVLNEDSRYQDRVIDHFYTRLSEKWLFKEPMFRKLTKFFKLEKSGDKGTVSLINDPEKVSDAKLSDDDQKYIFKYIDKYFITRRFIEKALRGYVNTTRIKWYDLYNNTDILKELFYHKLKKLIINAINELHQRG